MTPVDSGFVATKDEILAAIRREAATNGGVPPGMQKFEQTTGIKRHAWKGRYWARWNDALAEAGYQGREWGTNWYTDEYVTAGLAALVRQFGRFPSEAEITLHKRSNPDTIHPGVFRERLGKVAEQRAKVYEWAVTHDGWADVADIVRPLLTPSARTEDVAHSSRAVAGSVYLFRSGDFHKIGRSNSVGRRVYEVGLQLPERVDVVHEIETDDPEGIESYWHRRFAGKRANGEWFRLTADDIAAFRRRTYM